MLSKITQDSRTGSIHPRVAISDLRDLLVSFHGKSTYGHWPKIQQILKAGEKDLIDRADELHHPGRRSVINEQDVETLRHHLDDLKPLLAPVRRLPNDTLALIFEQVCLERRFIVGRRPFHLELASVCSHWCSVVYSMPSLWARFEIRCDESSITLLHDILERSKGVLLDLYIDAYSRENDSVFGVLQAHSTRWKTISVHGVDVESLFFHANHPTYPALESLVYKALPSIADVKRVISLSPKLRSLKFEWMFTPCERMPMTEHRTLRACSLKVERWDDELLDMQRFFESVTFPSLDTLCLDVENTSENIFWPASTMTAFVERSGCHLTTLSILAISISDEDLSLFLLHIPSLMDLSLCDPRSRKADPYPLTNAFVSNLHAFRPSQLLLPNLRRLHLIFYYDFNETLILDMIVSRWLPDATYGKQVGVSGLEKVEIGMCLPRDAPEVDFTKFGPLKYLQGHGIDIYFTTYPEEWKHFRGAVPIHATRM
ncbi:hypothetical protein GYMLUDRAFT_48460 [Collybiopsis luxurians FD-317 M1]|uniref:F-box domain-containing protein n=1 Tax=Collybiopsis luxurians FD-317 M1 TaxID=944289 RepID=A0A0D0AW06_9AGAR|nr:hypothetical protein GYMLUDRAFT_48460 [Collybiopsis luxurians FD-317 M1]